MSVVYVAISVPCFMRNLTFISMTVVARQPLPPRPSATALHNRADFLPPPDFFFSLASDLIWEKSESAAVDGS